MSTAFALPDAGQAHAQIRAALPGITFYRWGQDWYEFRFAGNFYRIPPDLPNHPLIPNPFAPRDADGRTKPEDRTIRADGTITVRTRYGWQRRQIQGDPRGLTPPIYGPLLGESTEDIAVFLLMQHSERGVMMLTGIPEKDEQRRNESRKLVLAAQRNADEQQVSAYRERVEKWERDPNKARLPQPRPTRLQKQAQLRLDALKESGEAIGKYICEFACAVETNDFTEYSDHMQTAHGITKVLPGSLVPFVESPSITPEEAAKMLSDVNGTLAGQRAADSRVTARNVESLDTGTKVTEVPVIPKSSFKPIK